jgi:hypothetical protein
MGNGRDELPLVRVRAALLSRCPIHKAGRAGARPYRARRASV